MKKMFEKPIVSIILLVIGFFSGIGFVNNWLVINKNYPKITMFNIPFDSQTWGTVSDWTMVLITFFTAIYLVKTFRQQMVTNKLLIVQHKNNIKPNFDIEKIDHNYKIVLRNSSAKNINIKIINHKSISVSSLIVNTFLEYNFNALTRTTSYGVGYSSTFLPENIGLLSGEYHEIAIFEFDDVDGNKYSQKFYYQSDCLHFTISNPL